MTLIYLHFCYNNRKTVNIFNLLMRLIYFLFFHNRLVLLHSPLNFFFFCLFKVNVKTLTELAVMYACFFFLISSQEWKGKHMAYNFYLPQIVFCGSVGEEDGFFVSCQQQTQHKFSSKCASFSIKPQNFQTKGHYK